jgi:endonuclease/exonuclease/phosphatase family metal-dependent hydrolase
MTVVCLAGYLTSAGSPALAIGLDPPALPVRLLQLNLCNSGFAACFTGRSTAEAAAVIRAQLPDLVTLNEVCQDDVAVLGRVLGDLLPGEPVASAFRAAFDTRTAGPMRCRDGRRYGIGVISRWPLRPGSSVHAGTYPAPIQDGRSPEQRVWLCLDTAGPASTVCTTHLASASRTIAAAQCAYLFDTVVARLRARAGSASVVVGADLNLAGADSRWSCTPSDYAHVDDAGLQHVVGTPGIAVRSRRTIELHGATDHPALVVALAVPPGQGAGGASGRP